MVLFPRRTVASRQGSSRNNNNNNNNADGGESTATTTTTVERSGTTAGTRERVIVVGGGNKNAVRKLLSSMTSLSASTVTVLMIMIFFSGLILGISSTNTTNTTTTTTTTSTGEDAADTTTIEGRNNDNNRENRKFNAVSSSSNAVTDDDYVDDAFLDHTTGDIWHSLGCEELYAAGPRPVPSIETWMMLRKRYERVVGRAQSTILSPVSQENGFYVPVEGRYLEDKGRRAVVALEDVPANTLIYTTTKQTARFGSGEQYRQFLSAIPDDLVCDVLQWTYVQDMALPGEPTDLQISIDLDEGSFCNDGGVDEANAGCNPDAEYLVPVDQDADGMDEETGIAYRQSSCNGMMYYWSLRDIAAGEEIQCSYVEFTLTNGLEDLEL